MPKHPHPGPAEGSLGILVVDDQSAVRVGIARLIACAPLPLRAVITAIDTADALRSVARMKPQIVVLDVDLGGEDGLALIPHLPAGTRVLVISSHGDTATRTRARELGACAFVEKLAPAAVLISALLDVAAPYLREDKPPTAQGTSSRA